jgi:uncharacterized Zn finger protein (UPF0148 family)
MSKYICERCGLREATVTSEAGRFCPACDELFDREQQDASLQEENEQLRKLVQRAFTLLDDIRQPHKNVERYHVNTWLEDAKPFVREHDE